MVAHQRTSPCHFYKRARAGVSPAPGPAGGAAGLPAALPGPARKAGETKRRGFPRGRGAKPPAPSKNTPPARSISLKGKRVKERGVAVEGTDPLLLYAQAGMGM